MGVVSGPVSVVLIASQLENFKPPLLMNHSSIQLFIEQRCSDIVLLFFNYHSVSFLFDLLSNMLEIHE